MKLSKVVVKNIAFMCMTGLCIWFGVNMDLTALNMSALLIGYSRVFGIYSAQPKNITVNDIFSSLKNPSK